MSKNYEYELIKKTYNEKFIYIPEGITLYRSISISKIKEQLDNNNNKPIPITCLDTGKKGSYFSIGTSVLSDFMTLEYNNDMILYKYKLNKSILVNNGKYAKSNKTLSHIEVNIKPVSLNYDDAKLPLSLELFISEDDFNNNENLISYLDNEIITVDSIKNKYSYACLNLKPYDIFKK